MKKKIFSLVLVVILLAGVLPLVPSLAAPNTLSKSYHSYLDFSSEEYTNISIDAFTDTFSISDTPISSGDKYKYNSMIFTIADIILFGYEDDTELIVTNSEGLIWEGSLDQGKNMSIQVTQGVYKVSGTKKFTVLTGDPVSGGVVGYYAMDKDGYGAGRELYTFVPELFSSCKFIVFAFEDNTSVLVKNTLTGLTIWEGTLNKGEHWERANLSSVWITVLASSNVSALTCYDQSYYVPSVNSLWSGTEFYTYVGNTGNWPHDLTVFSAYDNNHVVITDTTTQAVLWEGVLNKDAYTVLKYPSGADKYISIKSDDTVVVCVQPWLSETTDYHQGTYVQDILGSGIGNEFYATSLTGGYIYVLGYRDNTEVKIYNIETGALMNTNIVNKDEYVNINPGNGVWKIISDNSISVYSGWGHANAGFAPVEFGEAVIPQEGTWTAIYDSEQVDTEWSDISWIANVPTDSVLDVYASSSVDGADYSTPILVENGLVFDLPPGRYIKVELQLRRSTDGISPVVSSVTINAKKTAGPEWEIADKNDASGFKISSNAGSYDVGEGVIFYCDDKLKDGGKLVIPDTYFQTHESLTIVVNSGSEYMKITVFEPGEYDVTPWVDAKGKTHNINMLWLQFD